MHKDELRDKIDTLRSDIFLEEHSDTFYTGHSRKLSDMNKELKELKEKYELM